MPADYIIDNATWRDLNSIRRLEQICFPKDAWPIWDVLGVLTLPNVVRLKAVQGGELVGFVAADIRPSQNMAWIATIAVSPENRRQGIAKALLKACEARLLTPAVRLYVRASNEAAIRLYLEQGYYEINGHPGYYTDGEDARVFEKQLSLRGKRQSGL